MFQETVLITLRAQCLEIHDSQEWKPSDKTALRMAALIITPIPLPVTVRHRESSQYDPTDMDWAPGIGLGPGDTEVN